MTLLEIMKHRRSVRKYTEDYIRELLGVPSHYRLEAIMSLGTPAEQPQPYELDELPWEKLHKETF